MNQARQMYFLYNIMLNYHMEPFAYVFKDKGTI